MAGAIAGTSSLDLELNDTLDIVTLVVNDLCNLSCPHCYLQTDPKTNFIDGGISEYLVSQDFRHLAIVGKEPLLNPSTVKKTSELISSAKRSGKSVSLITNGLNLTLLDDVLFDLSFIDVSFDGGPETYPRNTNYDCIVSSISDIRDRGFDRINFLHTLYSENIKNIDDMMKVPFDGSDIVLFSSFLDTANAGETYVSSLSLEETAKYLSQSRYFCETDNSLWLIDSHHLKQDGLSLEQAKKIIDSAGLSDKVNFMPERSVDYGILRVHSDGSLLLPRDSLNTASYVYKSIPIDLDVDLGHQFQALKRED